MQDEPTNQMSPQERVAQVRPYWETLSHEQQVESLTLDVEFLYQRAVEVTIKTKKQLGEAFCVFFLVELYYAHQLPDN